MTHSKYMPQLDGIRAIAVWCVFVAHWAGPTLGHLLPWGELGVDAFFVLSGYLITKILLGSRDRHSFRDGMRLFYARRILRIFPIYFLLVAVLLALPAAPVREHAWWYLLQCSNFLFLLKGAWNGITDHFWSLAVEEQFYLCWPFIVFLVPLKRLPWLIVGLIGLGTLSRVTMWFAGYDSFKVFPLCCVDFLGMGALIAYAAHYQWRPFGRLESHFGTIALGGLVGMLGIAAFRLMGRGNIWTWLGEYICFLPMLGWLVWAAARGMRGWLGRLLEARFLRFSGRISYGLYLYHMPIGVLLSESTGMATTGWAGFTACAGATYAVSMISWFVVERPLLELKRHYEY